MGTGTDSFRGELGVLLEALDFADYLNQEPDSADQPRPSPALSGRSLEEAEERLIADALKAAGGNKTVAAQALGINRSTLYRKMTKYGLS